MYIRPKPTVSDLTAPCIRVVNSREIYFPGGKQISQDSNETPIYSTLAINDQLTIACMQVIGYKILCIVAINDFTSPPTINRLAVLSDLNLEA